MNSKFENCSFLNNMAIFLLLCAVLVPFHHRHNFFPPSLLLMAFWKQVALVIEPKDREASTMYKQALELLSQALEVWPNANVKFNYLDKLLSSIQQSQSKDPSTALAQGLDVMNKVLEKQPHLFIRNNINHISQV